MNAFPFLSPLQERWQDILTEYRAVSDVAAPWHEKNLYNHGWDVFGLVHCGTSLTENQDKCPVTSSLIANVPGLFMAGFSVLKPGCVIAPHIGYTPAVLRSHVGLVCPDNCALQIGDNVYEWKEGEVFVFDDTQEHSAWNLSASDRVVLIVDFAK